MRLNPFNLSTYYYISVRENNVAGRANLMVILRYSLCMPVTQRATEHLTLVPSPSKRDPYLSFTATRVAITDN